MHDWEGALVLVVIVVIGVAAYSFLDAMYKEYVGEVR